MRFTHGYVEWIRRLDEAGQAIRPAAILGDPTQIQQVILNLAVNARDALPEGGTIAFATGIAEPNGAVRQAHPDLAPGRHLVLTVSDTGVGIPESVRHRIFDPFFTTKELGKGTGMGLAMAYGIVKNHGGAIDFASEVGRGTTFTLRFPFHEAAPAATPAAARGAPVRGQGRILLVDDEEVIRNMARAMLAHLGYEVSLASDGQEAVAHYAAHAGEIDLVILDMTMPRMNGRDCLREIRKVNPGVKAVISTGHDIEGESEEIPTEGVAGFLQKPYVMAQLAETVSRALK